VTNYWGLFGDKRGAYHAEIAQGLNVVKAAKETKIKHLIFSTLE
jgi:hypothetical protein